MTLDEALREVLGADTYRASLADQGDLRDRQRTGRPMRVYSNLATAQQDEVKRVLGHDPYDKALGVVRMPPQPAPPTKVTEDSEEYKRAVRETAERAAAYERGKGRR